MGSGEDGNMKKYIKEIMDWLNIEKYKTEIMDRVEIKIYKSISKKSWIG